MRSVSTDSDWDNISNAEENGGNEKGTGAESVDELFKCSRLAVDWLLRNESVAVLQVAGFEQKVPRLSKVARRIFAMPAILGPRTSIFSVLQVTL